MARTLTEQQCNDITRMLKDTGFLSAGTVTRAQADASRFPNNILSTLEAVAVEYSDDSSGARPANFLRKSITGELVRLGQAEARFYDLARATPGAPAGLITCYGTALESDPPSATLLLEDMGDDFVSTEWPLPPSLPHCETAVATLAAVHASWWASGAASDELAAREPQAAAARQRMQDCAAALYARLGDALSSERRALIERVVARFPEQHAARLRTSQRHTIVSGDAHFWNFLIPQDSSAQTRLIDWQLWGVDLGAADLAYMLALHWYPERRRRFERGLVDHYAATIRRAGIDYDDELAWEDYRFMVAGLMTRVVVYANVLPAYIWWSHMERALLAFDDLACADLL